MQIVIDIPDYDYRQIKEYYEKNDTVEATYSYIYHGTPLPKRVDVQKWIYTECPNPNCNYDLSTDGYYSIEDAPSFCPKCGQAILWKSEG